MEPLPNVHKAYSIVLRIEKQREVQIAFTDVTENSAMLVKSQNAGSSRNFNTGNGGYGGTGRNNQDNRKRNAEKLCDYCKMKGHLKDSCFKLIGFLDWYKELKES